MLKKALPKIVTSSVPGPKVQAVLNRRSESVPNAVRTVHPCVIARGEGAMFEDLDGNIFLDWAGGVGVLNVGYSRHEVIQAIKDQSEKYLHTMMNVVTHEPYIEIAETLNRIMPVRGEQKNTFIVNIGGEANENAIKIARRFTKRPNIIVFSGAFHGRTLLCLTMTASKKYSPGMGPFPDGIYRAEFPYMYRGPKGFTDEEKIEYFYEKLLQAFRECSMPEDVAAIVLEPVQGEGGFIPAPIEWVQKVRKFCDEHGILLIADEVQTGFARSGRMFVSNYWAEAGCEPDIITTGKSIAAGLPLAAVTARKEIFDSVPSGTLGGTYCGNVVACEAAKRVLEIIEKENLCDRALEIGAKIYGAFKEMEKKYGIIGDVRGIGSMMGIEFVKDKAGKEPNPEAVNAIVAASTQRGLVLQSAGVNGNVIRFLCPLVVTDEQLDAGLAIFEQAISDLC